jgi:hypothetical protein
MDFTLQTLVDHLDLILFGDMSCILDELIFSREMLYIFFLWTATINEGRPLPTQWSACFSELHGK